MPQDERGREEEFPLLFEVFTAFDKDEKEVAETLIDGLLLKHQVRGGAWVL